MRTRYLGLPGIVGVFVLGVLGNNSSCDVSKVYLLDDHFSGPGFSQNFAWETFNDPTHGRVNYVDMDEAFAKNLSYFSANKFVMRVDDQNVVTAGARGRDSVRITSHKAYGDGLFILDVAHIPTAWWTVSKKGPWPAGGEIDIIEGVNEGTNNIASLHTTPGCRMNTTRPMTGTTTSTDCDYNVDSNQGCGVQFVDEASFGGPFNDAGGGWFAMERDAKCGISVWFWGRDSGNVPIDVQYASPIVRSDSRWPTPDAVFLPDSCDMEAHFDAHHIIFDDTLCGDWAGNQYRRMGCPGSCPDYVDRHPFAFREAYWEINSLRTYYPLPAKAGVESQLAYVDASFVLEAQ